MIEQDTVKLLRECDAGVKMGVKSIDDVIEYVKSPRLKERLNAARTSIARWIRRSGSSLTVFTMRAKTPIRSPRACPG